MNKGSTLVLSILSESSKERSQALKEIYSTCFSSIKNYVIANSGTKIDAEDVFQDGVSVLYDNIKMGKYKGSSSVKTYLFAICRNIWLQSLKKRSKHRDFSDEMKLMDIEQESFQVNLTFLDRVMNELKIECKTLLLLFYYERKSISEIKSSLNMNSEQVVKNKKKRCLTYLMNIIKDKNLDKFSFYE